MLPNAVVHPIFHGKNRIQRWLAAISALNKLHAPEPYPMSPLSVAAIRCLHLILTNCALC